MAFGPGGGKKGPRVVSSKVVRGVKLRPAPVPDASSSKSNSKGKERAVDLEPEDDDEEDDGLGFTGGDVTMSERKPLDGCVVTVTGCAEKVLLLETAGNLGARAEGSLRQDTTHLIADRPGGSTKFDMAVKHKMKIMRPSWVLAVRDAWTSAEPTDWAAMERDFVLPLFHTLHFCLTGFPQGPSKTALQTLLATHGATISPTLSSSTTHLIIATSSPASPSTSSTTASPQKLHQALRSPRILTLREGWIYEVIANGGIRSDRTELWKWVEGGSDPHPELQEREVSGSSRGREDDGRTEEEREREELMVVKPKRAKTRLVGGNDVATVDHLINNYTQGGAGAKPSGPGEVLAAETSSASVAAGGEKGKGKGKDRARDFAAPSGHRTLAEARAANAARARTPPPGEGREEEDEPPIFAGLEFAVVLDEKEAPVVRQAILARRGKVLREGSGEEERADWVIVPCFSPPTRFRNTKDPRVVTVTWIERCIFEERVVELDDRLLEKPIFYAVPLPGADRLAVTASGFSEIEGEHIKRFVEAIGGSFHLNFNRSRSHLIHASIDEDEVVSGPKAAKALEWGLPVVGLKWLREWAKQKAVERDGEDASTSLQSQIDAQAFDELLKAPVPTGDVAAELDLSQPRRATEGFNFADDQQGGEDEYMPPQDLDAASYGGPVPRATPAPATAPAATPLVEALDVEAPLSTVPFNVAQPTPQQPTLASDDRSSSPRAPSSPHKSSRPPPQDVFGGIKAEPEQGEESKSLLRKQTSAMLAQFEMGGGSGEGKEKEKRRNRVAWGRKGSRSATESTEGSANLENLAPPGRLRVPGVGVESSQVQSSQMDDINVRFEDPMESLLRKRILGLEPAETTTDSEDQTAHEESEVSMMEYRPEPLPAVKRRRQEPRAAAAPVVDSSAVIVEPPVEGRRTRKSITTRSKK